MQPGNKPLKLSIVIPAYNEESHLELCLTAIARQTVAPDEVVVVDNNSTDATAAIARRHGFVTLVRESRQGIVHARNRGFDTAAGTLIGRIDADTILPPDWVEQVRRFYADTGHRDSALTGGAAFRNMPAPAAAGWLQRQLVFRLNRAALGHHILWGSNMVLPREVWRRVRGNVCTLSYIHEDIDLAIHVHREGFAIVYLPRLMVSAVLRRVLSSREQLWPNLKWWPRTLRRHRFRTWPLAVCGAGCVYALSWLARQLNDLGIVKGRPD